MAGFLNPCLYVLRGITMSDIERLENELRQSKQMLLTLSSQISSMESELEKIKASQVQTTTQNQIQNQNHPNMQAKAQFHAQETMQNPMKAASPYRNPANIQPGAPAGHPANMQPGRQNTPLSYNQPGRQNASLSYNQPGRPNVPPSYTQPVGNTGTQSGTSSWNSADASAESLLKKFNTEELLGKNIMGIAASVLIFISFILFAVLMVPLLTDNIKVILMLTVSLGITAFGLIMWFRKDRKSTFFLSLSACGVGAVYISLFMCNAYFHIINDIVLYLLILFWAAGVLVLSKYKQRLFEIIGEVGILISIIFGCAMCAERSDGTMIMILTFYSIIGITAFLGLRIQDAKFLLIHGIFAIISAMALSIADNSLIQN
jgi:hypothetical protein